MRLNPRCAKRSIANWPRPQRLTVKSVWTPHAGETLLLRAEQGNTVDRFAVTVVKDSNCVNASVLYRRSGFNCEYLLNANCEDFKTSQLIIRSLRNKN